MHLFNSFPHVPFLYSTDDAAGSTDDGAGAGDPPAEKTESQTSDDKSTEAHEKKFTQADLDRIVKERLDRERKKSEDAAAKAKADAEQATMKEQGQFKELAEQEKTKRETLEAELHSMKLRGAFEKASSKLGLKFANEAAEQDAFDKLNVESVGDDLKGMDDAIKGLLKDRPYLFEKVTAEDIDAKTKRRESDKGIVTDARKAELKQRYRFGK